MVLWRFEEVENQRNGIFKATKAIYIIYNKLHKVIFETYKRSMTSYCKNPSWLVLQFCILLFIKVLVQIINDTLLQP